VSLGGGYVGGAKSLRMPLLETLRQAWADPDLRARIMFIFMMFAVFVIGIHIPVPIPGVSPEAVTKALEANPGILSLIDMFGGGALRRVSIFALGMNPYITSSIIMQILTTAIPQWKKELQEGGEYARRQQNRRTRALTIILCVLQAFGLLALLTQAGAIPGDASMWTRISVVIFWTAGAMFILWLGEQISEKGIGNGVSLMIFAGIIISMPYQFRNIIDWAITGTFANWMSIGGLVILFLATTWFIVYFTAARRQIPIQHMRRQVGTKAVGGQTSYLPIPINTAGVIPIIFAVSLIFIPRQFAMFFAGRHEGMHNFLMTVGEYLDPGSANWFQAIVGILAYTVLIFFFTYFYTAIQYNVEDLSNNLKRSGSFIPGVRPGKQTKEFLDSVISRVTVAGAAFLTIVALIQYLAPRITGVPMGLVGIIGGTSLLIMVTVALETMRQIEANLLMKHYGQ
jgi:preprotein translocase subunit SecY